MTLPDADHLDAMSSLLEHVVDSFEKLEVVVHLYRTRSRSHGASSIGHVLQLSARSVAEALAALLRAGIVRTEEEDDCAEWCFDSRSPWVTTIEVLVEIYEMNRGELLRLMRSVAIEQIRARRAAGTTFLATTRRTRSHPN